MLTIRPKETQVARNDVAIDLGGTTVDVAIYDSHMATEPIVRGSFFTEKVNKEARQPELKEAFRKDWNRLRELINVLLDGERPDSISFCGAGRWNKARTCIEATGSNVHWVNVPIVKMLENDFHCPVAADNDGVAMALREAYSREDREDFLLCIWGTGNNISVVRHHNGVPFAYAAEGGHQLVERFTCLLRYLPYWRIRRFKCGCGRYNCLEAVCGGGNLEKRHGSARKISRRQWKHYARVMARGIYNAAVLHPVPLVVFTGGVISKQPWLLKIIELELLKLKIVDPPRLEVSQMSEDGPGGALAIGRRQSNGDLTLPLNVN
jgi:predicted NBD/HSP70 family sugar kinase